MEPIRKRGFFSGTEPSKKVQSPSDWSAADLIQQLRHVQLHNRAEAIKMTDANVGEAANILDMHLTVKSTLMTHAYTERKHRHETA